MTWPAIGPKPKSKVKKLTMKELRDKISQLETKVDRSRFAAGDGASLAKLKKEYTRRISKSSRVAIFRG